MNEIKDVAVDYSPLFSLLDIDRKTAQLISKENEQARRRYDLFKNDIAGFIKHYFPDYILLEPPAFQKAVFDIFEHPFRDRMGKWHWKVTEDQADELRKYHRAEFKNIPVAVDLLRGIALCAPRETGKSTVFARLLMIWLIVYDYVRFVAYFRANSDLAENFLADTMAEFEGNQKLIKDFGNLKGPVWNRKMYSLKNGAVAVAVGKDSNIRGLVHKSLRPDLIYLDDLTSDKDKNSPRVLDSTYDWLVSAVFGLSKNATIIYLNTIYNELDPMYRIQQRVGEGSLPRWLPLRFSAEIDDRTALWPELWPLEELRIKKAEVGSLVYSLEYMSIVSGGKDKILPKSIFIWKPQIEIDISSYEIHFGVDPNAEGSDDGTVAVVGKHIHNGRYLTIDAWCMDNATITDLVDILVKWNRRYQPAVIAWEKVSFQQVYQKLLQEILLAQGINLPLVGIEAKGSKESRATALQPFIENGSWEHSEALEDSDFMMKIHRFPTKGLNDGPVDALGHAFRSFNRDFGKATGVKAGRPSRLPGLIGRYKDGY